MPDASQPRQKSAALQAGDTVGIVAPASNIKREMLEAGCAALRALGYKPFYFDSILDQDLYFAGPVERRARELEQMFERDEVRAILCARGGYGANYLLPALDLKKIARQPKIFVGYSDLTCLLTWLFDAAGLVTFHGPMVTKDFALPGGVDLPSWQAAMSGQTEWSLGPGIGATWIRKRRFIWRLPLHSGCLPGHALRDSHLGYYLVCGGRCRQALSD